MHRDHIVAGLQTGLMYFCPHWRSILISLARGSIQWEGDHVRLVLEPKDGRGLTKEVVARISACLWSIGCRCVLDSSNSSVVSISLLQDCNVLIGLVF